MRRRYRADMGRRRRSRGEGLLVADLSYPHLGDVPGLSGGAYRSSGGEQERRGAAEDDALDMILATGPTTEPGTRLYRGPIRPERIVEPRDRAHLAPRSLLALRNWDRAHLAPRSISFNCPSFFLFLKKITIFFFKNHYETLRATLAGAIPPPARIFASSLAFSGFIGPEQKRYIDLPPSPQSTLSPPPS